MTTTILDIARVLVPGNATLHTLAQQADSLLLDIQHQRGHNGLPSYYAITKSPRLTGGSSPTLMTYITVHNLSDASLHALAQRHPRYNPLRSKPDELLLLECRNRISALAIWISLIDDTDTGENAA